MSRDPAGGPSPVLRGLAKYAARGTERLTRCESEAAGASYAEARAALAGYEARVKAGLRALELPFVDQRRLRNLRLRLYRVLKRPVGPGTAPGLAAALAEFAPKGISVEIGVRVLPLCLQAAGRELSEDTVRVVARKARKGMVPKKKRPMRRRAFDLGVSADALLAQDSPLQQVRRRNALTALKRAMEPHQPVVREVVLRRLLDGLSYDELAERTGLTRDEVTSILADTRPWVAGFTPQFREDWYWLENVPVAARIAGITL